MVVLTSLEDFFGHFDDRHRQNADAYEHLEIGDANRGDSIQLILHAFCDLGAGSCADEKRHAGYRRERYGAPDLRAYTFHYWNPLVSSNYAVSLSLLDRFRDDRLRCDAHIERQRLPLRPLNNGWSSSSRHFDLLKAIEIFVLKRKKVVV